MVDVGWYRTTIRSFEREIFNIPNSVFSRNVVLNITRKQKEWRFYEFIGAAFAVETSPAGAPEPLSHSWLTGLSTPADTGLCLCRTGGNTRGWARMPLANCFPRKQMGAEALKSQGCGWMMWARRRL